MACCASCAKGGPCEGSVCGAKPRGSGEAQRPSQAPPGPPFVERARAVTGSHPVPPSVRSRASGDATDADPELTAFMRSIQSLPQADQSARLQQFMSARGASAEQTAAAVSRLIGGGLDALNTYLRGDFDRDMARLREEAATERERLRQEGETDREEIRARYGAQPQPQPHPQPQPQPQPHPQPQPQPASDGSGMMWLLAIAAAAGVGVALYTSSSKDR